MMSEREAPNYRFFISYRRGDHPDFVEHIRSWFAWRYGRDNVFMDFTSIPVASDYLETIRKEIEDCDALLAIIGPGWETPIREKPFSRDDWVRIEIGLALKRGKLVVPILIKGARVPERDILNEELRGLLNVHAEELRTGSDLIEKIDGTMNTIEKRLAKLAASQRTIRRIDEISPASGLALGYYANFVKPLWTQLHELGKATGPDSATFFGDPLPSGEPGPRIELESPPLVQILIPPRIALLKPAPLSAVLRAVKRATLRLNATARPVGVYARPTDRAHQLIDFPTTLTVLEYWIQRRLEGKGDHPQPEEELRLERKELDRFTFALNFWIADQANDPEFRDRVRVIPFQPDNPDVEWLSGYWSAASGGSPTGDVRP
jgi:hypothetical protein